MTTQTEHAIYALYQLGWSMEDLTRAFNMPLSDVSKARKRHWKRAGRPQTETYLGRQPDEVCPQTNELEAYLHAAGEINVVVSLPAVQVLPGETVFDAMKRMDVVPSHIDPSASPDPGPLPTERQGLHLFQSEEE